MRSMTGFGSSQKMIPPFGSVTVEMRSINHKYLETVFHLPPGMLSLEDKIKNAVESRVRRGRITCVVTFAGTKSPHVRINQGLLTQYVAMLREVKKQCGVRDDIDLGTLIHLPGVLSVEENKFSRINMWPRVSAVVKAALVGLVRTRIKEGNALCGSLKRRARLLDKDIEFVRVRFQKALIEKLAQCATEEERGALRKSSDIAEEMERCAYHVTHFISKLSQEGPVGKELDFIAQEMQREVNTLAAKTFDVQITGRVVQMKSTIEKIREQVPNVE